MLKKLYEFKDKLVFRRSYLNVSRKSVTISFEARALDQKIKEVDELIQYIKFYEALPSTYDEFLNSSFKNQVLSEFKDDFVKEEENIIKEFEKKEKQIKTITKLVFDNKVESLDDINKKSLTPSPLSSFYESTLSFLCELCPMNKDLVNCVLFQNKFSSFFSSILNIEDFVFYSDLKEMIQNSKIRSPKKLAVVLYSFLKKNPNFLSFLKGEASTYCLEQVYYAFSYYLIEQNNLLSEKHAKLREFKIRYAKEMNGWISKNLPHKYIELKNSIKNYIYSKLNQIMIEELPKQDLISSGMELKNSLFQIYYFLTKQRNSISMHYFYSFLSEQKEDIMKFCSEAEIELFNPEELTYFKEESLDSNHEKNKQKKFSNFIFQTVSKIRLTISSWFEQRKGYQLNYTPKLDQNYDEKLYGNPKQLHKDYLFGLGIQIVGKIQTEFNSLSYSSKWKEEMMQKFPILTKNVEDITIADLKKLSDFYTSFLSQVKLAKTKACEEYQTLSFPELPQDNFFLSVFQKYVQVDFNDYQKMSPEDIKYFLKLLRGILMDYSNQQNHSNTNEKLLPEMKEEMIQTYFDAIQYVSSGKSRN